MIRGVTVSTWLLVGLVCLVVLFFWASVLSFFPVPWPDDASFFLAGVEWVDWPPVYRMHAQAPFVPTYDEANFNTLPGLPLLLGLGNLVGVKGSHGIRAFGMVALAVWVIGLALWAERRGLGRGWVWVVSLGALLSPVVRWGAMVVRTEIWQGLFWLWILMELERDSPSRWRLALFLALAAYFHYESVVWVIPVALGLYPFGETGRLAERLGIWRRELVGVAWRVLLLLSLWLIYVVGHWDAFWVQMDVQFSRLSGEHPYIPSISSFFPSLFPELGNPLPNPGFLDLGNSIFWALLVLCGGRNLYWVVKGGSESRVRVAALAAVAATLCLWVIKPEIWFTVLVHVSFWPLLILSIPGRKRARRATHVAFGVVSMMALLLFLAVETGMAAEQWQKARPRYAWETYYDWVDCIDQTIAERTVVWQPHWPDVLVELGSRKPQREYFRALDFKNTDLLLEKHVQNCEAIVHSLYLTLDEEASLLNYQGSPRELDLFYLAQRVPFPEFSAPALQGDWRLAVCHRGPFWAAVSFRDKLGAEND